MVRREITVLGEVIEAIVHTIEVTAVDNSSGTTSVIATLNTLYLNLRKKITIATIEYRVTAFTLNESITLEPLDPTDDLVDVNTTEFIIPTPNWYHGTPNRATSENKDDQKVPKYQGPMIWLWEWVDILPPENRDESTVRSTMTGARIFFLDDCEQENWNVNDHYAEVIDVMENEMWFIYDSLMERLDIFGEIDHPQRRNHADFGKYVQTKGYEETILVGRLSGVQATFDLPFVIELCDTDQPLKVCPDAGVIFGTVNFGPIESGITKVIALIDTNDDPVVPIKIDDDTAQVPAAGGGTIDIEINGTLAFDDQGVDVDIPVVDDDSNPVGTWTGTEQNVTDSGFVVNGNAKTGTPPEQFKLVTIVDQDDNPVVVTDIIDTDTAYKGSVNIPAAAINTSNMYKTGQTVSAGTGTDGDLQRGRGDDWFNLGYDNPFGSQKRFTGTTGGYYDEVAADFKDVDDNVVSKAVAFPNDLVCCWSQWNQVGKIFNLFYAVFTAGATNAAARTAAGLLDVGGFDSGWALPNRGEIDEIADDELVGGSPVQTDYQPFDHDVAGTSSRLWTGTAAPSSRFYGLVSNGNNQGLPASSSFTWFAVRETTEAEIGL